MTSPPRLDQPAPADVYLIVESDPGWPVRRVKRRRYRLAGWDRHGSALVIAPNTGQLHTVNDFIDRLDEQRGGAYDIVGHWIDAVGRTRELEEEWMTCEP